MFVAHRKSITYSALLILFNEPFLVFPVQRPSYLRHEAKRWYLQYSRLRTATSTPFPLMMVERLFLNHSQANQVTNMAIAVAHPICAFWITR
jgi:hypothetical protein